MNLLQLATHYLNHSIKGRYVTNNDLESILKSLSGKFLITKIGSSVMNKPIYGIEIGTGKKKILMWSQMHGNESTTTKGLFDFFNYLDNDVNAKHLLNEVTLFCIPILNPDGAELYTRLNANEIDLNRDALDQSQPESRVLRKVFLEFKPDYCFNLHDQRTIFGTDGYEKPATMSFLAPAFNIERDYNETRLNAITIINSIHNTLKDFIPEQIGRFDDSFNDNCVGDYFTTQGKPTILFEAGHYSNDYERDEVRKFVFISLFVGISSIYENVIVDNNLDEYLKIPQNKSLFYDFIYKNIKIIKKNKEKLINFAAQYHEVLVDSKIQFIAKIVEIDNLEDKKGHYEFDGKEAEFDSEFGKMPKINEIANFSLKKMLKFHNGIYIN